MLTRCNLLHCAVFFEWVAYHGLSFLTLHVHSDEPDVVHHAEVLGVGLSYIIEKGGNLFQFPTEKTVKTVETVETVQKATKTVEVAATETVDQIQAKIDELKALGDKITAEQKAQLAKLEEAIKAAQAKAAEQVDAANQKVQETAEKVNEVKESAKNVKDAAKSTVDAVKNLGK